MTNIIKLLSLSITWIVLLSLLCVISIGQDSERKSGDLLPDVEIVANVVHQTTRSRSIYLYLDQSKFTEDSVSRIFQHFDKSFCEPFTLSVTIFSDRKMLDWFIKGRAADVIDFDFSTPQGKMSAAEYMRNNYPPPSGYLRAHYYRNERWEYFDFSPTAGSIESKRIVINDTGSGLKADSFADFPKSACKLIVGN